MKIGFLFAGQGSQYIGMGKDLYERYDEVKDIYNHVNDLTGIDIKKISFDGPIEELNRTKYTQLAVLTMSLAILEILKKNNIEAEMATGLSLGEYSALIYSGAMSLDDGIKIVQKRAQFMDELLPEGNWSMAAIIGLNDEEVEKICYDIKEGFVKPVNYNCKGQVVISGDNEAVVAASELAKERGARVSILNTSGPFHTSMLNDSSKALAKELLNFEFYPLKKKVIKNIDGEFYQRDDDIRSILSQHVVNPVRLSKGLEKMLDEGIDTFIEIGPGKTLSSFIKKTSLKKGLKIDVLNTNDIDCLLKTIEFIKEKENV